MKIEVLLSVMNLMNKEECLNLIKRNNITSNVTIVNQVQEKKLNFSNKNINCYSYFEKGLSKSRNHALQNSKADICLIADQNLNYEIDYQKKIKDAYKKYPNASVIVFHIDHTDAIRKKKRLLEGKKNLITAMKFTSCQITFKRKDILEKNVKFDENFGAGTDLFKGEENIFLSDCLKKGLKIYYIPVKIATLVAHESSWFKGYDYKYFYVTGALFYRMYNIFYPLFNLQFAIRKKKISKEKYSCIKLFSIMNKGSKYYKKSKVSL